MNFRKILSLICALCIATASFAGCGKKQEEESGMSNEEKTSLLRDAYVFTLPLVIMDATNTKMTNTVEATSAQAPANQFIHAEKLADASFTDVVTPNVDTIYSQVFVDLTGGSVILEFPKTDRFCTVEILDAYTNCVQVIETAEFAHDTEKFLLMGQNFDEVIPDEEMTQVSCPTDLMWVIVRTVCYGDDDVENVHEIQSKMDSYTLSQFESGDTETKAAGTYNENNNFNPLQKVMAMSMEEYFTTANELMDKYSPKENDRSMLMEISKIGVGPGLQFDSAVFDDVPKDTWSELVSNINSTCLEKSQSFLVKNEEWSYFGAPIAEFGTEYEYRALISLVGLGANPVSVAIYPKTSTDSEGNTLSGENSYVLHFAKDSFPEIRENGFWSVTAYDSDTNLLIDNELDRYCISDRSEIQYNEDGSLDIYIQKDKPADDKVSNWIPVSDGDFHLILRIYSPYGEITHGRWIAPEITKNG